MQLPVASPCRCRLSVAQTEDQSLWNTIYLLYINNNLMEKPHLKPAQYRNYKRQIKCVRSINSFIHYNSNILYLHNQLSLVYHWCRSLKKLTGTCWSFFFHLCNSHDSLMQRFTQKCKFKGQRDFFFLIYP